tara:strand:- start:30765 stop:31352 length:588 start_codon:yes stop_codon:yes gene_type:complete
MNPILNQNLFFIKEHVGMFKAANNYDIHNPESQEIIMNCREEKLGFFTKMLRFTDYKRMTPFDIEIKTPSGEKILSVKRGVSFLFSSVSVYDESDKLVGKFEQKIFSIGGKFNVLDDKDRELCKLKGKWTSWDFKFVKNEKEYGHVSKKWAGLGKEMFTSADNYMLEIKDTVAKDDPLRILILAAVICIDMVLKE